MFFRHNFFYEADEKSHVIYVRTSLGFCILRSTFSRQNICILKNIKSVFKLF